jgi:hypothetical protein
MLSIQNFDFMAAAWAFGVPDLGSGEAVVMVDWVPLREEMLAVPSLLRVASSGPVETEAAIVPGGEPSGMTGGSGSPVWH